MEMHLGGKKERIMQKKLQGRETTLIEAKPTKTTEIKVPVVYYLSRNGGILEHPHFMEVPLSSPQGLHLRDVIDRLNFLRGHGFAELYSWSSKRSYRNGFVWQDLSDNDLIHQSQGYEYILKGSQLLESSLSFRSNETSSSSTSKNSSDETKSSSTDSSFPTTIRRKRNQSWNSPGDVSQYEVCKTTTFSGKGTNASTQTEDVDPRRGEGTENAGNGDGRDVVSTGNISNSSFAKMIERAEGSMESAELADARDDQTVGKSGIRKASTVLMQMIRCGSD